MTRRLTTGSLIAAVLAIATLAAMSTQTPDRVVASYLVGWLAVATTVLGMLLIVLIAHAIAVKWIVAVRRLAEHVVGALPWVAASFIPVLVMARHLYPWARGDVPDHLRVWLSLPWVSVRAAIYFTVWIGVAELVRHRALATPPKDSRAIAAAVLPLYALTLTSAAFDWIMSLTPRWVSTMLGVYVFAAGFVTAFAVLVIVSWAAQRFSGLTVRPSHYHALGRMLFAFVVFWTYIAFSQFFIIHMADLPEEAVWAVQRLTPHWLAVTYVLYGLHFVVPFFVLLPRDMKRRGAVLAIVAAMLVVIHVVDMAYLVLPSLTLTLSWLDFVAFIAIAGTTIATGTLRAHGRSLVADGDPQLAASLRYTS